MCPEHFTMLTHALVCRITAAHCLKDTSEEYNLSKWVDKGWLGGALLILH